MRDGKSTVLDAIEYAGAAAAEMYALLRTLYASADKYEKGGHLRALSATSEESDEAYQVVKRVFEANATAISSEDEYRDHDIRLEDAIFALRYFPSRIDESIPLLQIVLEGENDYGPLSAAQTAGALGATALAPDIIRSFADDRSGFPQGFVEAVHQMGARDPATLHWLCSLHPERRQRRFRR